LFSFDLVIYVLSGRYSFVLYMCVSVYKEDMGPFSF